MVEYQSGQWFLDEYQLHSDTVINALTYKKLEMVWSTDTGINLPLYTAAIREDTALKMVYIWYPMDTTERVLYDFNLLAGEQHTFHHCYYLSPAPANAAIATVDSIGSYTDEFGINRKVWYLDMAHLGVQTRIVEGVGSNSGLISYSCHFDAWSDLICVHNDSLTYYINDLPFANHCAPYVNVSVSEIEKRAQEIRIHPNPSKGDFTLHTSANIIDHLEIYTITGNLVLKYTAIPDKSVVQTDLNPGVYVVVTRIAGETYKNRLVISD